MKIIYILILLIFIILNIVLYLNSGIMYEFNSIELLPSLILLIFFYSFKKIINKNIDWFSIDSIFIVIFYLFHFGYLYLYALGLEEYDKEVFWDSRYIYQSIHLLTACCSAFLFGCYLSSKNTNLTHNSLKINRIEGVYFLSKILILISTLMFWLPILSIANIAFSDYKALISVGELSPIGKLYWIGQYIGVTALAIYYLCKTNLNKPYFDNFFSFIPFFYIISYFIIGDRGGFLFYVIIPITIYNLFYKKFNILKIILGTLFILILSTIIAFSRVESNYNIFNAYTNYQSETEKNPVLSSISEFGKSFKTVPISMSYIPEHYDYWYGKSYIDSFLITFPNLISTRVSSSIAAWLTQTAFGKDAYGRGGSIVMESYGNFGGIASIFFFILLGFIGGFLYKKFKFSRNLIYAVAYVAFVASLCLWMRNTSTVIFRTVIWSILITFLFIYISKYLPYLKAKK